MSLKREDYEHELAAALCSYEKFIVCLEKTPDEFLKSLESLLEKAIQAFETRGPGLRHGIALETDGPRPLCGIYFNLHSPYRKESA